jgi:hypothetical protein
MAAKLLAVTFDQRDGTRRWRVHANLIHISAHAYAAVIRQSTRVRFPPWPFCEDNKLEEFEPLWPWACREVKLRAPTLRHP